MATFREIVYSILDLLKERSDDAYYTEEHVLFLVSQMRALLLERKYKDSRNSTFNSMSSENKQTVCLTLAPDEEVSNRCHGSWLKSNEVVPKTIGNAQLNVYPIKGLLPTTINYIAPERMPYVGHNKWLNGIIYCTQLPDGHLYLHSSNPQFLYLESIKADGVFADPEKAAELSCESSDKKPCDVLDAEFPLEQSLVPSCIELVLQELLGSRYAPEDKQNNAKDDLGAIASASSRAATPAESSEDNRVNR